MSHIIACYKWVLDEGDVRIGDDLSVDTSHARYKISDFDRSSIEAAVKAAQQTGATPVALTFGNNDVRKSAKDALSRGPEKLYCITAADADGSDAARTAACLKIGVDAIGDASLIVCSEGSSDAYARQVAPRLGVELGIPVITSVLGFGIDGNRIVATRKLESSLQTVSAELPCVVSVLAEDFEPHAPGLRDIMQAGKKPVEEIEAASAPQKASRNKLVGFSMQRKNHIIEQEDAGKSAEELVKLLKKDGVL